MTSVRDATKCAAQINGLRLWQSLLDLASIGATEKGGVCRLALTELDKQARDLFCVWATTAGCTIRIDAIGNIFARRAGRDEGLPPIATGSHIDSQPTGGKFDGAYGVLAGLEVIRALNDAQVVTAAPLEVVVWTNEEGSRFVPVMMGSGVYAHAFTLKHALDQRDRDGVLVKDALKSIGYAGDPAAPRHAMGAYFEAHIEQGPILEASQKVIGAVTSALGQRWYDITIQGMEAHAGPTPMNLRRDALLVAADLIKEINAIAQAHAPDGRGTVGWLDVFPNSRNVIPGRVRLTVDLRAADDKALSAMDARLREFCRRPRESRVTCVPEEVVYFPPQKFSPALVQRIRDSARDLHYEHTDIVSGAGHDAVYVARVAPTAMIFIPCKNGISHNEVEDAEPEHLAAGASVLLHAMLSMANVSGDD